jgi:hypothetical protein
MAGTPEVARVCGWCGDPIHESARRDAAFCCRSHKASASRRRRKNEEIRGGPVTPSTLSKGTGGSEDGGYLSEGTGGSAGWDGQTMFHRLVAASQRRVSPVAPVGTVDRQKRNPGVKLPELRALELEAAEYDRQRAADLRAVQLDGRNGYSPQDRFNGGSNAGQNAFAAKARANRAINRNSPPPLTSIPAMEYEPVDAWRTRPAQTQEAKPSGAFGRRLPARYYSAS